jgi:hypothetical protein
MKKVPVVNNIDDYAMYKDICNTLAIDRFM